MTPFTHWLGQQWWGPVFAMLIDVYLTKDGRRIARQGKIRRKEARMAPNPHIGISKSQLDQIIEFIDRHF